MQTNSTDSSKYQAERPKLIYKHFYSKTNLDILNYMPLPTRTRLSDVQEIKVHKLSRYVLSLIFRRY